MQGFVHIHAVPPAGLDGEIDDVFGLGQDAYLVQNMGEANAGPFGNEGPAFFAGEVGDLAG